MEKLQPNLKKALILCALGLTGLSFLFYCFGHTSHLWELGDIHGGLWVACVTSANHHSCQSLELDDSQESNNVRAARAFMILDVIATLGLVGLLIPWLLFDKQTVLSLLALAASSIHAICLFVASVCATVAFRKIGLDLSWAAGLLWLAFALSLGIVILTLITAVLVSRSKFTDRSSAPPVTYAANPAPYIYATDPTPVNYGGNPPPVLYGGNTAPVNQPVPVGQPVFYGVQPSPLIYGVNPQLGFY